MSLLDEIDENTDVVPFRPEDAGEGVEGRVISIDVTSSEYTTDDIPVINIETPDGVVRQIRGYHSVLRNEIERAAPKVGDTLAVKYNGKKPTKDGKKSFHSYGVKVARKSLLDSLDEPGF